MSLFTLTNTKIQKLLGYSRELNDLFMVSALLAWDQETYLPPKAVESRSHQLETLSGLHHDIATKKSLGKLLDALETDIRNKPASFTDHDKALVREMKREYTMATKLPKKLVQAIARESSMGLENWKRAREQDNFALFADNLQHMVELKQQVAKAYGYKDSPYDALLDEYEQGLTKQHIATVFEDLKKELLVLIPKLHKQTKKYDTGTLKQTFDGQKLWDFSMHLLTLIGFDLARGRQDKSTHPFTMGLHPSDVRLTTRILETNPISTLLSTIHEAGHGMYEQGIAPEIARTTLGVTNSLVIHESQSRLWENMIGKSLPFWKFVFPQFQATFPDQLKSTTVKELWHEANVVKPSFIRVDADEVSYHMHIIIRFEIESALIEGTLKAQDVPRVWNEKYKEYLGVDVPNNALGCLQDIHWSQGLIGYFPTYSFGSLLAAQLFATLQQEQPSISEDIAAGKFEVPLKWLNSKIHQHGRVYTSDAVALSVTGEKVNSSAFMSYIAKKFSVV